ncbi:MAG: phosphoglycerate kinase [Candidatus Micrarchaeota archaeon]
MEFLKIDDVDVKGKTLLVRVDINSSIDKETGKFLGCERIEGHAQTVKELAEKGARVVVLAHQGRAGDYDFTPLKKHARMLKRFIGRKVKYVDSITSGYALRKIAKMQDGDVIMLENVRYLAEETLEASPEELGKTIFVKTLSPVADYYVSDAFSAAHRGQCSIVGFSEALPTLAGRVMEREVNSLSKVTENPEQPCVFLLGGAKPEDSIGITECWLAKGILSKALTSGVLGQLFMLAQGKNLGSKTMAYLEKKKYTASIPKLKELLQKYPDKIEVPIDVAIPDEVGARQEFSVDAIPADADVKDIGTQTAQKYAEILKTAKTTVVNGPAGVYEEKEFGKSTKTLLKAIEESGSFSLMGGGHTISALAKFKIDKSKISYISLAGKAFIAFLSGEEMPGIAALEKSARKFKAGEYKPKEAAPPAEPEQPAAPEPAAAPA